LFLTAKTWETEFLCTYVGLLFKAWLHVKQNYFEIIVKFFSVFFTCNHVWKWNKIISAAEKVPKLFEDYFSDIEHVGKYSWAAPSLWNNLEIISDKFPCA